MSRTRVVIIIVVLVLANFLVFGNLVVLLINAGNEAVNRAAATRVPRPTTTTIPVEPTDTPIPQTTNTPTPTPTPVVVITVAPTAAPAATATSVPAGAVAVCAAAAPFKFPCNYTIKAGDSLSVLSNRFKVPATKIMSANNITNADLIKIGQTIIIPEP